MSKHTCFKYKCLSATLECCIMYNDSKVESNLTQSNLSLRSFIYFSEGVNEPEKAVI